MKSLGLVNLKKMNLKKKKKPQNKTKHTTFPEYLSLNTP